MTILNTTPQISFPSSYRTWLKATITVPRGDNVYDLERQFLIQETSPAFVKHNLDMYKDWFTALGYTTGTLADKWYAYLGSLGYTGSLRDRLKAYFEA